MSLLCRCWDGVRVRHLHLRGDFDVAVKLLAHCEKVTLLVEDAYVLDLGSDHLPSAAGFLRLLTDTRLKQLELIDHYRWVQRLWSSVVIH